MNIEELKAEIEGVMNYIITSNLLLYFINEPNIVKYFKTEFDDSKAQKPEDRAISKFSMRDGEVSYLIHPAFDYCKNNPDFNLSFIKRTLMVAINSIWENLPNDKKYSYSTDPTNFSPEFEFFRHIRNGCAHNNTLNVLKSKKLWNDDINYKAIWNNIEISLIDDGKSVFFDFLKIGDTMLLLEFVRSKL